jgi:gas vesicle protein
MMENTRASAVKMMALMFLGGAVLGAVAGLLFAPKSGRETREDIKDYAVKVKQDVTDVAERTKAGIEAALEKGRALLSETKAA